MIDSGRCTVQQGDVSDLQFRENSFDLATAFETIYFWPGLERCFAQVAKILKQGGYFLICNESDGEDADGRKFEGIIDGMTCYTPEQIEVALKKAGFSEITTDHHPGKPWITVLARNHPAFSISISLQRSEITSLSLCFFRLSSKSFCTSCNLSYSAVWIFLPTGHRGFVLSWK